MYTLREMYKKFPAYNTSLGNSYIAVFRKEHFEEFDKTYINFFGLDETFQAQVYGFVVYDNGSKIIPLYQARKYHVLTENGSTFENLTLQ